MPSSIESRITALEQRLASVSPAERQVLTVRWVGDDSTADIVAGYSAGSGYELRREPDEDMDEFNRRATAWIRTECPHESPRSLAVLWSIPA